MLNIHHVIHTNTWFHCKFLYHKISFFSNHIYNSVCQNEWRRFERHGHETLNHLILIVYHLLGNRTIIYMRTLRKACVRRENSIGASGRSLNIKHQTDLQYTSRHKVTSSNGNIFGVTGHLCGQFTGPRWIPHTKASDAELWCFL